MEENEEKGFVVKDRRRFSQEGDAGEPASGEQQEAPRETVTGADEGDPSRGRGERAAVLPEVTISTFVLSLSSSALMHLGEIPDPETHEVRVDLPLAKHIIDTLGMLQEKTKGNLEADEDSLFKSMLYDLRLRYVQKSQK
jgi:hypothetical protein